MRISSREIGSKGDERRERVPCGVIFNNCGCHKMTWMDARQVFAQIGWFQRRRRVFCRQQFDECITDWIEQTGKHDKSLRCLIDASHPFTFREVEHGSCQKGTVGAK